MVNLFTFVKSSRGCFVSFWSTHHVVILFILSSHRMYGHFVYSLKSITLVIFVTFVKSPKLVISFILPSFLGETRLHLLPPGATIGDQSVKSRNNLL